MASNCTLGIHNLVKTTLNNKPWFEYDQSLGIVNILDSPKNKINKQSSFGVAKVVANTINKQINNGYKDIGDIAFARFDEQGRGYVDITPTINQIQLINAQDELEIEELQKELDEERKLLDDIKNKEEGNYDVVDGEIVVFSKNEYDNEANILRFSDLRQELRVQEGKLNFKNGKISDFEILSENSVIDKEISQQQALEIFNKKNKNQQDKKDLSIYFANYFLNSVYDKEGLLYLGYTRFLRYGITSPKLLIVKDNGRKNPFFQYNNVVIIGLKQIEKFIDSLKTPTFEKFENLINTVAQEEIIHLYADYLLDHQDLDNIYNEMTEKDIKQIKKIYGNSVIQKENIVHEYVRMVVQQKVFGRTTEYESFTLSNAIMSFFENLIEELNDFLSTIIGSTNTKKAIEDVINFTKGNFSKELDEKIINRVFEKGKILEANLNVLNNFQEEQKELDKIVEDINNLEDETKFDDNGQGLLFGNLQDLAESRRIAVGNIKVENRKIVGFERKPNPYLRDYNTDLTEVQTKKLFEKSKKSEKDYEKLAVYFTNMFVSEIIDKDVHLRMGYTRLDSIIREEVKPKILITNSNKKTNPFYQYNNTIIVGIYQMQQLLENGNYKDFEQTQKLIQSVAQEEAIHLFAEYLFDKEIIDNIYSEMSKKDIQKIKDIYGNQDLPKSSIVHEYVRMVVQQHVFNSTTEQEKVKLTNSVLEFISGMIDQIRQFLKEIIGQDITKKAIQDVIDFTKGNFSEELDSRIINKIFEQGSILESNLQNIESNTLQVEDSSLNQTIKPGVKELFETDSNLANAVYEALGFEIPTTKLQGKQFEYGEPRFFDVVEKLTSGERANLPSSILINKLLKGEYLPEIKESQIILGLSEAGIWRPNIKKIEASGENKSTLAKKIGHELLHSVTSNIILSYQNLKGTVDFTDKYYKDFIRQGYIKPVDLSKSQIEALDNLVRIRNKVISYVEQNKDKIQKQDRGFGTYDYFIRTNYTESETDLHEFISEVFTNPELINILKEIPTEGKKSNLFKDFVDAIAKILGFTNTSILEDIIAYSEEAFFTQPQITPQQKQQASSLFSEFLDVYLQDYEQVEKILKEENIIQKKCN
jgi:hypothetical protein